ncbi:zinc-binding alcohol dehydrogenase family protein [Halobacillus halophilus]|uniref:Zinc-type alcohol dehydrogenase-like protein n=1 Tax=Halobacillus halophilus (strain ATCC 35676 / DSM 2266 / JCM 20832 / KCTC 3685 / LMG 17431 / NBRC 102448 / NCIMB 2269) TaxID=866895 RepID=I0JLF7_HALH3|nr:zinc-binding alcohol dehydrogenase family protein [Halobacillus halophilus]ASF39089.1 zinc-binding alcohol dehydrogenase family protein [Halobacillus halophilus]CCG44977.1 zinc-binding alcohol dehydrogenase family protein [Halobacillus halophilus DSM 2266]
MTEQMNAVGLYKHLPISEDNSLVDVTIDKPEASGRDILVKIKAVSVNPVDTKVRANGEDEEEPKILGYDAAGVVESVGEDVTSFEPGDEVYYAGVISRPGTNSDYHLVDERIAAKKPQSLSFREAAALPLTGLTAWEALYERLGISTDEDKNKGKSILIIGAAGGVGSIATQLANEAGLTVIGTASREETVNWAKDHGAHYTINHRKPLPQQLRELEIDAVDYIFCLSSTAEHWDNMTEAIAPQGKICSIVETEEHLDLTALQQKSAAFVWEFMFTRPLFETEDMQEQQQILTRIAEKIDNNSVRTTLTETLTGLNAEQLREAHRKVESGKMIGKVVVEAE